MFCLHICSCTMCVPGANRGQKKDWLLWELGLVVSHHMGVENQTWVLCQNGKHFEPPSYQPYISIFLFWDKVLLCFPGIQSSTCLCLLSAVTEGVNHNVQLIFIFIWNDFELFVGACFQFQRVSPLWWEYGIRQAGRCGAGEIAENFRSCSKGKEND